jgi:hypothetical protein
MQLESDLTKELGILRMRHWFSTIALLVVVSTANGLQAAYIDIVDSFEVTRGNQFPVQGKTFDDIESSFGTRIQSSTGLYDFHRGIDIDGTQGDQILAPVNGLFWEYREFTGGGNTIILQHDLNATITYNSRTYDHYYTYYLHLFDDGAGGTDGTDDVIASWTPEVTTISAGDLIGKLGNSGTPPGGGSYSDHLHLEMRFGTRSSLEFQLNNPGNTQHGFDPHMNPMLLFNPYTYATSGANVYHHNASLTGDANAGSDIAYDITYTNDDMPLLNEITVSLEEIGTGNTIKSHTLDLNQRIGFDPSSTANLDTVNTSLPYFNPVTPAFTSTQYKNGLIVPSSWTSGYGAGTHKINVQLTDLWRNSESLSLTLVPEPASYAVVVAAMLTLGIARRRLKTRSHSAKIEI